MDGVDGEVEKLRESEATLRAILDAIPDLVFRMRRDGSVVEPGDGLAHATRGSRELHGLLAAQSVVDAARALATGRPKGGLCRVTDGGQARDYETRVVPYGNDETLVIARDISDYTRTEEELQLFLGISLTTSEVADLRTALTLVLRQICESTGWVAGAAWMPVGAELRCDAVSLARETPELASFRDECTARSVRRDETLVGGVLASGRAAWVVGDLRVAAGGASRASVGAFRTGFAVPVLAGREVVAVLEFYAFEPRDEDERLLTMVSAVAEQLGTLVKRKRAEELVETARAELQRVLETAARQWRMTFDAIESPIVLLDRDGRIVRVNRAAKTLAGADYKEQIGRLLEAIGEGEPWRGGAAVAREALRQRAAAWAQARDDVRKQTWDFSATSIDDDGAKVIVVMRDITKLVELQESLRRSETMSAMGSLVAGVAHEVRNPLHALTVTLDAFEARFRMPEHAPHLGVLRGEITRLSTLMRDLLEYGKPPATRLDAGSVAEVVVRSLLVCAREAQERRVTIARAIETDLPSALMDADRLLQVVNNVLENAIQHSKAGDEVTIAARTVEGSGARWVELSVSDQGSGFRTEDLARVFEPFFSRRKGGTGLGLSIVQRIVDMHGGRVWASNRARSETDPGGATITVRLPTAGAAGYDPAARR